MSLGRSIWEDLKLELQSGNIISRIIVANVLIFIAVNLLRFVLLLIYQEKFALNQAFQGILSWIAIPYNLKQLVFRPWTLFTHMFLHYEFWHLFWNMILFYWFGRILKEFLGGSKILPVYVYGGLVGAVLAIATFYAFPNLYPASKMALGASAGVLAIVLAAATLVPDYTVHLILIGAVRIKYIALFIVFFDIISITYFNNVGGHFAHLGGAALGYVFITLLRQGTDLSAPFNKIQNRIENLFSGKKGPRMAYVNPTRTGSGSRSSGPENPDDQKRLDAILDKISSSGYDSLSKEEKAFLFKMSRSGK